MDETGSNASSTDDLVRELLDPDDRPRNVWHVVEGPKVQTDTNPESQDAYSINDSIKLDPPPSPPPEPPSPPPEIENSVDQNDLSEANEHPTKLELPSDERTDRTHRDEQKRSSKSDRDTDRHNDRARERERDRSSSPHRRRHHDRDRERDREKDKDKDKDRGRGSDRDRETDRDRNRHRRRHDYSDNDDDDYDYERRHHDKDRHYRSHSSRDRHRRSRSRSKTSSRRRGRSRSESHSPITKRNSRTILLMQLSSRADSHDLEEFFSDIGKVREVRLIMDSKTRRHKGIAYIEFEDSESAAKAYALNGQDFMGAPMVIQSAQMEKGRSGPSGEWSTSTTSQTLYHTSSSHSSSRSHLPPNSYRVYLGGLHVNLTEEMLRSVFEPFGPICRLELMRDRTTNISRGYAFVTYADAEDGQSAVQALDGLELGGKAIKVSKSNLVRKNDNKDYD